MGVECICCSKTMSEKKMVVVYQGNKKKICEACLDSSDEYDECYMCKSLGMKIAYPINELTEDDSLRLLCEKHYREYNNHSLTEDEENLIDYFSKD